VITARRYTNPRLPLPLPLPLCRAAGKGCELGSWRRVRVVGDRNWCDGITSARDLEPPSAGDHQRSGELDQIADPITALSTAHWPLTYTRN